jgi:hypothetical protein
MQMVNLEVHVNTDMFHLDAVNIGKTRDVPAGTIVVVFSLPNANRLTTTAYCTITDLVAANQNAEELCRMFSPHLSIAADTVQFTVNNVPTPIVRCCTSVLEFFRESIRMVAVCHNTIQNGTKLHRLLLCNTDVNSVLPPCPVPFEYANLYLRVFVDKQDENTAVVKFAAFAGHRPRLHGLIIPYAIAYRPTFPLSSGSVLGQHENGETSYDASSLRTDKHVIIGCILNTCIFFFSQWCRLLSLALAATVQAAPQGAAGLGRPVM